MLGTGAASRDQQTPEKTVITSTWSQQARAVRLKKHALAPVGTRVCHPPELQRGSAVGESVFDTFPLAAEAEARRHQSTSGGSGDAAGVATGDDEEVELLAAAASYFSSRVFCF